MSPDSYIVGRVEEGRIDAVRLADDPLQKPGIAAIATSHPVISENPDIAWLRSWRCPNRRNNLVIGIGGRCEDHIDLARREASQSEINIDIERGKFAQFQLQD